MSLWTTKVVRHFIYTHFGFEYCRERVRQMLHALGFRLHRLRHREADGRLMLKAQPAYSPELNPQERIWKWLRRVVTHHHWFVTLHEQIDAIRNFFRSLAGVRDYVRCLCGFKTPDSLVALP